MFPDSSVFLPTSVSRYPFFNLPGVPQENELHLGEAESKGPMDHGWGKGGKLDIARAGSECCQLLFHLPISDHQRHLLNSVSVFLWQSGIYFPEVLLRVGFCLLAYLKAKENPEQGCRVETTHRKHFPYFSATMCTG